MGLSLIALTVCEQSQENQGTFRTVMKKVASKPQIKKLEVISTETEGKSDI